MLHLAVTGFEGDPDEVTAILGLNPTLTGRRGEPSRSGRLRTFNGWWMAKGEERLTDGREHNDALDQILATLDGRAEQFARLRQTLSPTQVTIYGGLYHRPDEQCGIWLDPAQMKVLVDCGVGWGLDIFE